MTKERDKLIHLQLVLLSLIESAAVADPTRELVEKASREQQVMQLLRDRCSEHPTFRSFDQVLGFDSLEAPVAGAVLAFTPRAVRYGFYTSGLCFVVAAISHNLFGIVARSELES